MANPYQSTLAVIALVGPDGVGKSTLLQDIARVSPMSSPHPVVVDGRTAMVLEVRTPTKIVQLVDFENAIAEGPLLGASRFAGAVLVVAAPDSVMPGHRQSLDRAKHLGLPLLAIALTKGDMIEDEEMLDLVEMEVRELASTSGYPGQNVPCVRTKSKSERPHEGTQTRSPGGPGELVAILAR